MLKNTLDKLSNTLNGIYSYACHCCMSKRDKPKYRKRLRAKLKAILRKEIKDETQRYD